ncbi:MAG TPA: AtpZ/AtpI family protein, partial [Pyrinomonadaceae bacterium]|nr:AtpZ/AtpI family protein [Pyrinomonadaceae bacterium]
EIIDGNCHHCGLSVMTEKEVENQLRSRERAVWPDEPSPFKEPFWLETPSKEAPQADAGSFLPAVDNVARASDRPIGSHQHDDPAVSEPTAPASDVWLNDAHFPLTQPAAAPAPPDSEERWHDPLRPFEPPFVPIVYTPETTQETVRRSGLAWSAGIVFFGAVAFMLFLGWLADLVLGSSPWGLVGGVILGSVIGFVQFFRISSQIYAPKPPEHRPLLTRDDDR